MKPRALALRKMRDGYSIHLSNTPVPKQYNSSTPVEDAIFDLEMAGYDVSRLVRAQAHKENKRVRRNLGGSNGRDR